MRAGTGAVAESAAALGDTRPQPVAGAEICRRGEVSFGAADDDDDDPELSAAWAEGCTSARLRWAGGDRGLLSLGAPLRRRAQGDGGGLGSSSSSGPARRAGVGTWSESESLLELESSADELELDGLCSLSLAESKLDDEEEDESSGEEADEAFCPRLPFFHSFSAFFIFFFFFFFFSLRVSFESWDCEIRRLCFFSLSALSLAILAIFRLPSDSFICFFHSLSCFLAFFSFFSMALVFTLAMAGASRFAFTPRAMLVPSSAGVESSRLSHRNF